MQKLGILLRLASDGSDDDLSELVDELHPRAVKKVADFLNYVAEQGAWCGIEFNDTTFRFVGSDQVRISAKRLNDDNVRETTEEFKGQVIGALPVGRTFEFKLADQEGVLRVKIGPGIAEANMLNQRHLNAPSLITLSVVQVGQGRPRYTLLDLADVRNLSGTP